MSVEFKSCACGDHAFAKASHWHVVLVSVCDIGLFDTAYSLTSNPSRRPHCAVAYWQEPKTYKKVHHLILDKKDGHCIDHANRDPTDNRRSNLRYATASAASRARKQRPKRTTGPQLPSTVSSPFSMKTYPFSIETETGGRGRDRTCDRPDVNRTLCR